MHDTRVFRRSHIGQCLLSTLPARQMIPAGSMLIGDAGYPENASILLPYPSGATGPSKEFNYIQSSTRIVVEQTFGRLKNRFRILLTPQNAWPIRARNNTFACMILHNLLNRRGALYLQDWDARTADEHRYGQRVPRGPPELGVAPDLNNGALGAHVVSMWTRRDEIRDNLCGT
jgi:hypothetical protein